MKVLFNSKHLSNFIKKSKFIKDNYIHIKATQNTIKFTKTDFKSQISLAVVADVLEEGELLLPNTTFKLIKDGMMTIEGNTITTKNRKIELTDAVEGYCALSENITDKIFEFDADELKHLLEVEHAISTDKARPILNGIHIKDNKFMAIDGHVYSERECSFRSTKEITVSSVKLLKELKGKVKVYANDKYVKYVDDYYTYVDTLIEGDYIDAEKLKPKDFNSRVTVENKALESILSDIKDIKGEIVYLKVANSRMSVSAEGEKINLSEVINADVEGDYIDIAFNPTYLLNAIKTLSEKITLKMTTNVNPVVVEEEGKYELVLPVRVCRRY